MCAAQAKQKLVNEVLSALGSCSVFSKGYIERKLSSLMESPTTLS